MARALIVVAALIGIEALAGKAPIAFSPTLGADPSGTQAKLATLEGKLPASFALPASLKTLVSRQVTMSFFPEAESALLRAGMSGPGLMTWPTTSALCTKHVAFSIPAALLVAQPSTACVAADTTLRQQLLASAVCREVEQPERYVLSYAPAVVNNTTTATIESLIGLAGEGLSHHPAPDKLLPADWVPTLRSVVWKIREAAIAQQVAQARASYAQASALLTSQAACFEATARSALAVQLADLDAELVGFSAHLTSVVSQGTATATQDLACLSAKSRARPVLPFPALTDGERRFVAFWMGGVYWRMRGGGLMPLGSTNNARTFFLERPFRRIGELTGGVVGEEVGYRIYLNIFDGWGEWMDMGTTAGGQDLYEDLVQMTDRGRHQVADNPLLGTQASAVKYLSDRSYETTDLYVGGMDMGPCYLYGLDPLLNFRYADQAQAPYGPFIEGFTAVGEFCTGASIALGMAKSLLNGTPTGQPPLNLCSGKQCGDDGCGGTCGTCAAANICVAGQCVSPPGPDAGAPDAGAVAVDAGEMIDAGGSGGGAGGGGAGAGGAGGGAPSLEDAGTDGGGGAPSAEDAGTHADAGTNPELPATGCGCNASASGLQLAFALLLIRTRRRAQS
jgi:hypothetical protein